MIFVLLRENLTRFCFNNSSSLCKCHIAFSLSLLHFSTSGERHHVLHPTVSEFLQHKHHFSPEAASQVASVVTHLRNPENSDSVLSFLKKSGFSKTQVEKMLKHRPQLLSGNLEKIIKPKIMIFQELGLAADDIAEIISNDPWILKQSLKNRVIPSLSVLKSLLGSNDEVAKFLKTSGWFLKTDLHSSLIPNVELLRNCGIATEQIIWMIYHFPRSLLRKPETIKKFVDRADEMGVSRSSKMFIHAIRIISSMSDKTWERKLRAFRRLGFSEDQIAAALKTVPMVFGVSEKKITEVKKVILASGMYKLSCIFDNPVSIMYSVKKRHKPRLQVLETLKSKNLIKSWPSFSTICCMPEKKFYEKFVGPYIDELGDVNKGERHPVKKKGEANIIYLKNKGSIS